MATAYNRLVRVPGLDAGRYLVNVTVVRKSGRELTAEELELCERLIPGDGEVTVKPSSKPARAKKPAAKRTAATAKRKAAKRS